MGEEGRGEMVQRWGVDLRLVARTRADSCFVVTASFVREVRGRHDVCYELVYAYSIVPDVLYARSTYL